MDTERQPDEPAEEPPADDDDAEAQQRREALADLLEQIELHGQL